MAASSPADGKGAAAGGAQPQRITELAGFEILEKIGQGGMGAVYKARQRSLDRLVALKVLPPKVAQDSVYIERFIREARASARLNHPNIVQGIDVGQEKGLHYFAMEFVDGRTLKQLLRDRGALEEKFLLRIMREVAEALDCAHQAGLVHRDVKPDNILLASDGTAKLADLGLAKQIGEDASLTQSGMSVGTPHYISPEQAQGEKNVDGRSDLYSLGATWFHLATGRVPFEGDTSAVIMVKHLNEPVPKARGVHPGVSEGVSRLIERLMRKKRAQRFQTARELIAQIDLLAAPRPVSATGPRRALSPGLRSAPGTAEGTERVAAGAGRAGSRTGLWAGLGLAGLAAGIALIFLFGGSGERPRPSRPAETARTPLKPPKGGERRETERPGTRIGELPPVGPESSAQGEALWQALEEAKRFEGAHPEEYGEARIRYEKVGAAAAGTPAEGKLGEAIAAQLKRLEERSAGAAEKSWNELAPRVNAAAAAGEYDEALRLLGGLPERAAALLADRLRERSEALKQEAQERITAALTAAESASKALEPSKGLAALAGVEKLRYAPLSEQARALKARLEGERADEGALKQRRDLEAARRRLEEHLGRFDEALLGRGDWQDAKRVAEAAAADQGLGLLKEQATALNAVVAAAEEARKVEQEALQKLEGQEVDLTWRGQKIQGRVSKVAGESLVIQVKNGPLVPIRLGDLAEEQRQRFRGKWRPEREAQKVAAALELLAKTGGGKEAVKDPASVALLAEAAGHLASASAFPFAAHWMKEARRRRVGVAEAAAEEAWKANESFLKDIKEWNKETGTRVLEWVGSFEKKYSETEFGKGKAETLAQLKRQAEAGSPDSLPGGPATREEVQRLFKGQVEEFDPDTNRIALAYDFAREIDRAKGGFRVTELAKDWEVVTNLSAGPAVALGHKALFSGDLEFSCKVSVAGWWFQEKAHGGVAWQGAGEQWEAFKAGLLYNEAEKKVFAQIFHCGQDRASKPVSNKKGEYPLTCVVKMSDGRETILSIEDAELVRTAQPFRNAAMRPFLPTGVDAVLGGRLAGTLQKAWLAEALKGLRGTGGGLPSPGTQTVQQVQKLFRGRVEAFDPGTLRIRLAYDFQSPDQQGDWSVPTRLFMFLEQGNPRGHVAIFSGDLEFTFHEALSEKTFGGWPSAKGGLAWQGPGARDWDATAAGFDYSIDQKKNFVHLAVGLHRGQGRELRKDAPFGKKSGGVCVQVFRAANEQPLTYAIDGKEVLRDSVPFKAGALRPVLPAGEIHSAVLAGTLQREWLAEKLKDAAAQGP